MSLTSDPVRLGAIGLGRAFALTAPALAAHPGIRLVAAAAPRAESRAAFAAAFGGRVHADVDALVADPAVEAVYVSTPHDLHLPHALAALAAGKHVLVDKPMTVTLADADALVAAAHGAGRVVIVGPSHSFDAPVALARRLIDDGAIGAVRMISALYATDFLYRPRRAEELATDLGGGVIFSQAIHQVDVIRRLAGHPARRVTGRTGGAWDPARPTEGAYAALIDFSGGAFASLTYSGHAHFDGDRLMDDVSELGTVKTAAHGAARRALTGLSDEAAAKQARGFSTLAACPQAIAHEHFGQVIVFGTAGDLRLTPRGVELSDAASCRMIDAPLRPPRSEVCDAVYAAVRQGTPPLQDAAWGRASLEICHAILTSAETGDPVPLIHQGDPPP